MMRGLTRFFTTTAMGGLFVLLPLLLIYLLLAEATELVVMLATPITALFAKGTFDGVEHPVLAALGLIFAASFLTGLLLKSGVARRLGRWLESRTLGRLVLYNALKSLTRGFSKSHRDGTFRPALMRTAEGEKTLVYLVEELDTGKATVMLPRAPVAFSGTVKIVDRSRVELLDADLGDFTRVMNHWGYGAGDLLK